MKKTILKYIILFLLILGLLLIIIKPNKQENKTKLTKIKVAEVAHSIFYAPQYIADSLGFFKEEGLNVEITLSNGADAVMAAVLSNDVNIGFCGTEATI